VNLDDLLLTDLRASADVDELEYDVLAYEAPHPCIEWGRSADRGRLRYVLAHRVRISPMLDGARQEPVFSLDVRFRVDYSCPGELEVQEDAALAFARESVQLTCYPYFRELVSTMTARAGVPPLVLETLHVPVLFAGGEEVPEEATP
jgi:hypothetical protein